MPFKSKEQERYLQINEPEIHRDWVEKYGHFKGAESLSLNPMEVPNTISRYYMVFVDNKNIGSYLTVEEAQEVAESKNGEVIEYIADLTDAEREYMTKVNREFSQRQKTGEFFKDWWWKEESDRFSNGDDPYLRYTTTFPEENDFFDENILGEDDRRSKWISDAYGISPQMARILDSSQVFGMYMSQRDSPATIKKYRERILDAIDDYTPQSEKEAQMLKVLRPHMATRGVKGPSPSFWTTYRGWSYPKPVLNYYFDDYYDYPVPFMGYDLDKDYVVEDYGAEECVSCDTPDGYWRGLPLCSSSGEELCISCCACNVCRSKWNMLEVGEQKAESFSAEIKYQAVDVPLGMVCVLCENDKPATHRIVENGMPFFLCERHWFNYTMGAPNIDVDFSAEGRKAESFSAENYYGRNYRGYEINKEGDERQAFYYLTQGDNRIEIEFTKSVEGRRKRGDNYNYASYFYGNYPHTAEKMFETFDEALNWFDEQIDNGRMFKDFKAESFGAEDPLKYLSITGYYPKVGRSRRYSVHTGDRWNPIYYGEVSMRGDARGKWDFYWSDGDYGIEGDVRKNKSYYTLSPLYINGHFMANEGPTFQSRTQWDCVLEAIKYAYDFQPRVEGQKKKWWQFWKAESFNAEPDTIRFKVGERYTPLYYHGYGHSDIEIIRRTDKSVFVAQVDAQGNAAGNTLRYKIYTTPAVDIGGDRFPAQEYYKLTHGQPVRAGDTTKKAESFRSYKVAPDLSSYTKAELVSSIAGPQGTAAYDEVVYDPLAQSRLSAESIDSFSPARLIVLGASIGVALGLYNTRRD